MPEPGKNPPSVSAVPAALAGRILQQLREGQRFILGLTGPPGTGKSTVAASIAQALPAQQVVVVPMDGYHLASEVIRGTPLEKRKGAIDTFDAAGYAHLLNRLRQRDEAVVFAPRYVRAIEEPIAASIAISREVQIIITEGNYLLSAESMWPVARAALDQVWYLETPNHLRLKRLTSRHVSFGKSEQDASAWAQGPDEVNARTIALNRDKADLIIVQE